MKRNPIWNILFWSVISAAFVGPGTVTTAAKAGASFEFSLLWALLFSTLACVILQEAAARLPLLAGHNLGEAIAKRHGRKSFLAFLAAGAILVGGVAYQAGNLLGATEGIALLWPSSKTLILLCLLIPCALLLWLSSYQLIAKVLGGVVALMGIAFVIVLSRLELNWGEVFQGLMIPHMHDGSAWLVVGLIGTTIVPYNLFLGSGISAGQGVKEMRQGLIIAIVLGGLISMAILIVGTQVQGDFSFRALAGAMQAQLGPWAVWLFGFGLMAAGFSSAITAPMAAAITVKSIFGESLQRERIVWGSVLLIGFLFGVVSGQNSTPTSVIIAAQALNGLLLPIVTIFLLMAVNDPKLMPIGQLNPWTSNGLMLLLVGLTSFLGLTHLLKASFRALDWALPSDQATLPWLLLIAILVMVIAAISLLRLRKRQA